MSINYVDNFWPQTPSPRCPRGLGMILKWALKFECFKMEKNICRDLSIDDIFKNVEIYLEN